MRRRAPMRRHPGVWVGSQAISRPSGRSALQERQNLCQSTGIALQAFASRGCRQRDAQHSAALPATKVDRRRAVVVGKARQIRPAGQYEPDCRCNQCRTLPAMGVGGADAGGQGTMSRTLKVRGEIISQANRYLGAFHSSQSIFLPHTIQMLLAFHGLPPSTLLCSHIVVSYLATLPIHVWKDLDRRLT